MADLAVQRRVLQRSAHVHDIFHSAGAR